MKLSQDEKLILQFCKLQLQLRKLQNYILPSDNDDENQEKFEVNYEDFKSQYKQKPIFQIFIDLILKFQNKNKSIQKYEGKEQNQTSLDKINVYQKNQLNKLKQFCIDFQCEILEGYYQLFFFILNNYTSDQQQQIFEFIDLFPPKLNEKQQINILENGNESPQKYKKLTINCILWQLQIQKIDQKLDKQNLKPIFQNDLIDLNLESNQKINSQTVNIYGQEYNQIEVLKSRNYQDILKLREQLMSCDFYLTLSKQLIAYQPDFNYIQSILEVAREDRETLKEYNQIIADYIQKNQFNHDQFFSLIQAFFENDEIGIINIMSKNVTKFVEENMYFEHHDYLNKMKDYFDENTSRKLNKLAQISEIFDNFHFNKKISFIKNFSNKQDNDLKANQLGLESIEHILENCILRKQKQGNLLIEDDILYIENPVNLWRVLEFLRDNVYKNQIQESQMLHIYIQKLLDYSKFKVIREFCQKYPEFRQEIDQQIIEFSEQTIKKRENLNFLQEYLNNLFDLIDAENKINPQYRKIKAFLKISKYFDFFGLEYNLNSLQQLEPEQILEKMLKQDNFIINDQNQKKKQSFSKIAYNHENQNIKNNETILENQNSEQTEKLTEGEQYLLDNLEILKVAKQLQRIKDPSQKKLVFNEKLILILNELGLKLTRIGIYQELTQRIIKIIQEKNPFYVSQIMIEFINQEKYQINQRERERLYRIAVLECQDPKIFNQIIEAANKKNQNQQNLENLEKIKENASKRQMAKIKAQQGIKYATSFLKSTFNYSKKVLKGDKQKSLIGDIRIISLQERKLDNVELKEKIQQFYNHQFDKEEKEVFQLFYKFLTINPQQSFYLLAIKKQITLEQLSNLFEKMFLSPLFNKQLIVLNLFKIIIARNKKSSNFDLNFFNEQKSFSQEYNLIKKQIKEIKFHEKSVEYSVFIKFTEALIIDSNIDELSNFSQNPNNLYFNKAARNAAISELISSSFEIKDEEILQLRDFNSAHVILSGCIKQLKNQENLEKKYLSSLVQRLSKLEQEKTLITRGFQEGKLKNFLVLMEIINENDYKIKEEIDQSKIQILKIWNQAKINFEINRLFDSKIIFKTEQKNQDYYQKVLKSFQEQQDDLKNSLQKGSILLVSNCLKLLFKNQIEKNFIKFDQEIHFLYLKKILQENSENEYYIGISEYLQQEINVVLKKFDLEFLYSLLDFSKLQKVESETQMQNYLWLLNAVYENIFESANKQTVYNEIYSSQMIKKLKQEQILIKEIKEFKLLLWDQIDFTGQEISEYQCYLNEQIMNPLFFKNQQLDTKEEQICIDMILKIKNLKNIIQNYFEYFILRYLEQSRKQENNLQDIEINHNAILDINKFQTQFENVLQSQEKIDFSGFVKLCHIDKIFVIYLSQAISNRIIDINNKDFSPVKIIGFIQQLNKEIDLDISKDKFLVYQQILKVIYFLKGDDYFSNKYDYIETIILDLQKFTLQIFQISLAQIEKKLTSIITEIFKKQFQKNNVNSLILAEFIIEAIFYFDQITVNYIKNILYKTAISNFKFEFSIVLGILGYIQPINTFASQEKLTLQEETLQKTILIYKQTQYNNNDEDVEYQDSLEKFDESIIENLSKILNKQDQLEGQNNLFFNLIIHYFGIGQFVQHKQTFKNLKDTLLKQYNLHKNKKQSQILQDIQQDSQVKRIEDIDTIQQQIENIVDQQIFIFNAKFKNMDDLLIFNIISLIFNKQFYEAGKLLWQAQKNEQFSDINEVLKNLKQQMVALEKGTSETLNVRKGLKQLIQKVLPDIQKL